MGGLCGTINSYSPSIQAIAVIAGLLLYLYYYQKQAKHDRISRNINSSVAITKEWRSEYIQHAILFIEKDLASVYKNPEEVGYTRIPDKLHKDQVIQVSHLCDEIGARIAVGEIDHEFVLVFLGTAIAHLWEILEPYVSVERRHRKEERNHSYCLEYQACFESVYKRVKSEEFEKIEKKFYYKLFPPSTKGTKPKGNNQRH